MSVTETLGAPAAVPGNVHRARWPGRVGIVGMVIGAVTTLGELMELGRFVTWTREEWQELLSPVEVHLIFETLPSLRWLIAAAIFELGLGVFLLVGSWWLLWREPKAIRCLKVWSWTTIVYTAFIIGWVTRWLSTYWETIPDTEGVGVGSAYFGVVVAVVLTMAFPAFLLYWLQRQDIRRHYESWAPQRAQA